MGIDWSTRARAGIAHVGELPVSQRRNRPRRISGRTGASLLHACPHRSIGRRERALGIGILLLAGVWASKAAVAACIGAGSGPLAPLEAEAFREPVRALVDAQALEQSLESSGGLSQEERATLLALAGEAHRQLKHTRAALAAANEGLRLMGESTREPVSIRLRLLRAMMLDDTDATALALQELDALIAVEADNSLAVACAQKDRGWIRDTGGDSEGALRDLIAAYQYLKSHGPQEEAMVAAGRLATLYRIDGEFDAARPLILETITYFTSLGAWVRVATARERLGMIDLSQQHIPEAVREFTEMRRLSETAVDPGGIAFADLWICQARIELQDFTGALERCESARRGLQEVDDTVDRGDTATLEAEFGRIALGMRDPRAAVSHFEAALATQATELRGRLGAKVYRGLMEAEEARGHFAQALAFSQEYQRRVALEHNDHSARALAALRVQYDVDRQLTENRALVQERAVLLYRTARSVAEQRLALVIGVLMSFAVATVLWLASRKRLAEAARRGTEQRLAELGRLCAGVAHDFNNLMTVVQQAGGMLAHDPRLSGDPNAMLLVDAVREAARTGGAITQQLLAFGGQQNLRPQLIVCRTYFAQQKAVLQQAVGDAVTVSVLAVEGSLTVWTDPAQLTSALVNLVLNAKDAVPSDAMITLSAQSSSSRAGFTQIVVEDRGRGMSAEVLQRCTEVFFSTKEPGKGSGLGLSAVQGFANQSGGEFTIASTPGLGTTIALILPAVAPMSHEASA